MAKTDVQEFRPRIRSLFDLILFTDIVMLVVYAAGTAPLLAIASFAAILNVIEALVFFLWARSALRVRLTETDITGPTEFFARITIPRAKIDKWKTENLRLSTKKKGFIDIWALDGKRIRLIRPVMGRRQCYIIVGTLLGSLASQDVHKLIVPYPNE